MNIIKATTKHFPELVPLFDAYRVFYRQESNPVAAEHFLKERLNNQEAVIFIAYTDDLAVGFTQLYPLYSSVSMASIYVLNDLFIAPDYRNKNIGTALINQAKTFCKANQARALLYKPKKTTLPNIYTNGKAL